MLDLPEAVDVYLDELKARKADRLEMKWRATDDTQRIDQWDALHQAAEDWRHIKGDCDL